MAAHRCSSSSSLSDGNSHPCSGMRASTPNREREGHIVGVGAGAGTHCKQQQQQSQGSGSAAQGAQLRPGTTTRGRYSTHARHKDTSNRSVPIAGARRGGEGQGIELSARTRILLRRRIGRGERLNGRLALEHGLDMLELVVPDACEDVVPVWRFALHSQ